MFVVFSAANFGKPTACLICDNFESSQGFIVGDLGMDCSLGLNIVKENLNHVLMSVRYRLQMCHMIQQWEKQLFCKVRSFNM